MASNDEEIKLKLRHQKYHGQNLLIERIILDDSVYISWNKKGHHCLYGFKSSESLKEIAAKGQMIVQSTEDTGDIIDYIERGVQVFYRFFLVEDEADLDSLDDYRYVVSLSFSAKLPGSRKEADEVEAVRRRLQIREMERQAMSPAERMIQDKEQEIINAQAMIALLARVNDLREASLAETKRKGLPPEEEDSELRIKDNIFKDLARRIFS
jgi:hypothetical protein